MGTYLITGPDGKKYKITGDSPEGAMEALKKHMGGAITDDGPTNFQKQIQDVAKQASDANRNSSFVEDLKGIGKNLDTTVRGAADTLSFGFADELAAGGDTLTGGDNYAKNLEAQRARDKADKEERPGSRLIGQLMGGVTQGAGLVKNGLSPTATAITNNASLMKTMGLGALEGWGLGTLQGLGSGDDLEDRARKGFWGGAVGGVLGGAMPAVVAGGKEIYDRAAASFRPEAAKDRIAAAILRRSGLTADDVASRLQAAQDDGQDMFMAADALELPGQRIMSTTARTPNDARKSVVDALMSRQMDQGRRVAADLTDAAGTPLTADQYQTLLRSQRAEDAARNYAPVMEDTTAIDVTEPVRIANRAISPVADNLALNRDAVPTDLAARAPIEAAERSIRDPIREAVREARSYLAADNLTVTNVEKAFRAKTNIDQMIAKATENGQGAQVEALMPVRQALDDALAATSQQYASARDAYRNASGLVDAVDIGRDMARGRNRVDDTLQTFGALDPAQQQPARIGYFDPKIAAAETTKGKMPDVARQFTSDSMRRELPVIAAPGEGERLMRRLARENTMSDTAQLALGGSKTADNLSDITDSALDPGVVSNIIRGNFKEALLSALTQSANAAKGMPPSVVEKLAPVLMERNPEVARALLSKSAEAMSVSDQARAKIAAALLATGGTIPRLMTP